MFSVGVVEENERLRDALAKLNERLKATESETLELRPSISSRSLFPILRFVSCF